MNKIKLFGEGRVFGGKFFTCIALVAIIMFIFAGCGGSSGRNFTDVEKVEDWLARQKGGASPENPIPFSVSLNLQNMASPESNWQKLLTSINTAGLYVALDLSGSTMPDTEFNAAAGRQGKSFIVSLVLPDSAESVVDKYVAGSGLYMYFGSLKTVMAKNIDYFVGDNGPAGGIVFYDKGIFSNGWRYLEVAPAETQFSAPWGAYGQNVAGTVSSIGSGKRNTELIVEHLRRTGETGRAAQVCSELSVNGFNDWFLPSKSELESLFLYMNLHRREGFRGNLLRGFSGWFWSSSQDGNNSAWGFLSPNGYGPSFKDNTYSVRAVRAF